MGFLTWLRQHSGGDGGGRRGRPAARRFPSGPARRWRPWLEVLEDRCVPSTLVVTSPLDDVTQRGTLRYAVAHATSGDTIRMSPALQGAPIVLTQGRGQGPCGPAEAGPARSPYASRHHARGKRPRLARRGQGQDFRLFARPFFPFLLPGQVGTMTGKAILSARPKESVLERDRQHCLSSAALLAPDHSICWESAERLSRSTPLRLRGRRHNV